jgi:hypothetical protein
MMNTIKPELFRDKQIKGFSTQNLELLNLYLINITPMFRLFARAHPRIFNGTVESPIHKCDFFSIGKAAQGFAARHTVRTPQSETRGECSPVVKRPFMDGHYRDALRPL